jgi:phosphoribosylformimino-5-aminoimidazole carboxamide ribotide isomerase
MGGIVVRGVGGRREEYRPVVSELTVSCSPSDVARALLEASSSDTLYVADLDAIVHHTEPAWSTIQSLRQPGLNIWLDAGIRDVEDASSLAGFGIDGIIAGLETLSGWDSLKRICQEIPSERLIFSLDLKKGEPLCDPIKWEMTTLISLQTLIARVIEIGISRVIVLDLARVGEGQGIGTEHLLRKFVESFPQTEFIVGGGIRNEQDVQDAASLGISGALVCSALHQRKIGNGMSKFKA